jgi:hypothetical protein
MSKGQRQRQKQKSKRRALCALLWAGSLASLLLISSSSAEVAKKGPITVSFHGDIAPQRLPRTEAAPVSVQLGAKIKTTEPADPPVLDKIVLDINSHGQIQTKGLATCSLQKLESISTQGARKACGDALVGHGNVTSRVSLPGQGAFASNGPLLAFNGTYKGKQAIFAQVATQAPLPLTYVIVFAIQKTKGTFGTRLSATLPPIASEYGYISAFDMALKRTYPYKGKTLSYASAACPAPKGINQASFALAKATYVFQGGQELSETLVRQCKARGK